MRNGVDYFPLDTDFFSDKKIKLLKGEFGACGLVIVLAAFSRVYNTNGYYMSFDNDDAILMADDLGMGITPQLVWEVVQGCVKRSIFDEGVFNVFGVLTSPGIQRRYIRAVSKRDDITLIKEYWLLDFDDPEDVPKAMRIKITFKTVSGGIKAVSGGRNPFKTPDNPQSKVEESRGKKSRAEETCACAREEPPPPPNTLEAYASGQLNYLSPSNMDELADFMTNMPEDLIRHAIDEACAQGKRTWAYVRSILRRYLQAGFQSVGEVKAAEEARQKQKPRDYGRAAPNPALNYTQREHSDDDYSSLFINLEEV